MQLDLIIGNNESNELLVISVTDQISQMKQACIRLELQAVSEELHEHFFTLLVSNHTSLLLGLQGQPLPT
ncbi:hypothetical protein S245_018258 [Arachis hypogaea]